MTTVSIRLIFTTFEYPHWWFLKSLQGKQIRARTAACNAKNGGSIISQLPANHPLVQQAALFTNGSSAAVPTMNNSSTNNYPPYSKTALSNANSNSLNPGGLPGISTSSSSSSHPSHPPSSLYNQGFVQQYGLAGAALYPKLSKSRHSNKSHSCRSVELTCRSDVHCKLVILKWFLLQNFAC